jgi:putative ABC transport system substrate-binding protein
MKTLPLFLALVCVNLLVPPLASAQSSDKMPRIGFLAFQEGGCRNEPFHRGLRELGYVEGKNFTFDCRHANGSFEGLDAAAVELVRAKPNIIVVLGHAPTKAAQRATQTIPIVMAASGEPVESGFAQSLARPGGNMTGVSYYNTELNVKRLEYLKMLVPDLKRLAVLAHASVAADLLDAYLRDCDTAGKTFGFDKKVVKFKKLEDLDRAFEEAVAAKTQGLFVAPMREVAAETQRLVELSAKHRLPVVHFRKPFAKAGGLMSYGTDYAVLYHRTATYVDKILKGADPAELPIEQPARFEFVVNVKAAKALGLTVPPELLVRADEVIR